MILMLSARGQIIAVVAVVLFVVVGGHRRRCGDRWFCGGVMSLQVQVSKHSCYSAC